MTEIYFYKEDEQELSPGWRFFHGVVCIGNSEFEFTLIKQLKSDGKKESCAREITWIDKTPENSKELEELIIEQSRK